MRSKIYFLLFLLGLFSTTVFAQTITLSNNSGPLTNDTMLVVNFDTTSTSHDFNDVIVNNTTAHPISVMLKKVYIQMVPGVVNGMCWGGLCTPGFEIGPGEIPASGSSTEFHYDYNPAGQTGISIIRYVFWVDGTPSDSVSIRIKYKHPENVGIKEINENYLFTNAYPNPANNLTTINYNFSSDITNASIVIYDLLGKKVKSELLSNSQGKVTINTNDLNNGIYLYSLVLNGRSVSTRKLVINH